MDKSIVSYAQKVYLALNGESLPSHGKGKYNPFVSYDPETLKRLVDNAPLAVIEKNYYQELEQSWALAQKDNKSFVHEPVKVTKGSTTNRGLEGWVVHEQPSQNDPNHKALYVFDFVNSRGCWVADHAFKFRVPAWNEWEAVVQPYYDECHTLAPQFKRGTRVRNKQTGLFGVVLFDCQINPNWGGNGFPQCKVDWQNNTQADYLPPTLLEIIP